MAEKTICVVCGEGGGTLRWRGEKGYAHYPRCSGADQNRDGAKSTFPFTTSNFDPNHPVQVQSMRHLRKLENQFGVASVAYNNDSQNFERS